MVERFESFTLNIMNIYRYWNEIATREMDKYGFKGVSGLYLLMLNWAKEGMTAANLAKTCGRDKAEVSRSISAFRKNGWLCNNEEKYRSLLKLSEQGKMIASEIEKRALLALEQAHQGMSEDKLLAMQECLQELSKRLRIMAVEGIAASK